MDIRLNNEYCTVTDTKGNVMVAQFFKSARVETLQNLQHSKKITDIDIFKVYAIPEDGVVEKDKLYSYQDKVICSEESGKVSKVKLRSDVISISKDTGKIIA